MKISILGSGSEGNCTYLEENGKAILVDAGFSAKTIIERLNSIDVAPTKVKAIVVTHEHIDHIKGVGILSRKLDIPIYISKESYSSGKTLLGSLKEENVKLIDARFSVAETFDVTPFDVSHDAHRTLGFRVETESSKRLTISTDIGEITPEIIPFFVDVDVVVLESNYDLEMLYACGYPYYLKKRIESNNGHLSNKDSGIMIETCHGPRLKKVYLAHISKNSNTYQLAEEAMSRHLNEKGIDITMEVALQHTPTKVFEF